MVTTFEAGGKLYELRYSFNALCEFEGKYDIGVSEALANRKSFYYLRGLLWSGMLSLPTRGAWIEILTKA